MTELKDIYNVFTASCPSRPAFDRIFSGRCILILAGLYEKPARFGELFRVVEGISERMLSKNLKIPEDEDLVHRQDFKETPRGIEYGLSERRTPYFKKRSQGDTAAV